jgi:hypothetical protein
MFPTREQQTAWQKDIDEFIEYSVDPDDYSEDNTIAIFNKIAEIYHNIYEVFIEKFPELDQWEHMRTAPMAVPVGFYVQYHSNEVECAISFGSDKDGYFLQSELYHAESLPTMDDNFWEDFLELRKYGKLEFGENAWSNDSEIEPYPESIFSNNSQLFSLIRNFILLEINEENGSAVGMLTIRWNLNESWEELIENGSWVFNRLYKLSKSLQMI